jgi:hypothetical protein
MLMKSLSNKDVALIKRALKYLKKNQELHPDTEFRLDYLVKDIEKDEMPSIYAHVLTVLFTDDLFDDVLAIKERWESAEKIADKILENN